MARIRQQNVTAAQWSSNGGAIGTVDLTQPENDVFGVDVFGAAVQRERLSEDVFERLVTRPHRAIVEKVRAAGVEAPFIGFPRGAGALVEGYAAETPVQAVALDVQAPLALGRRLQGGGMTIQGALDNLLLEAGGAALDARVETLLEAWGQAPTSSTSAMA